MTATRIAALRLASLDISALSEFYVAAFGCVMHDVSPRLLTLGEQHIEVVQGDAGLWVHAPANSPAFQHFAIVVSDMDAAMGALESLNGWSPISEGGPVQLPRASGGVAAFKFRDPEGHPLEFLHFPAGAIPPVWQGIGGLFLGIDHTAMTVTDTARSVAFYKSLGFVVQTQQLNRGVEQQRLDHVSGAVVEVSTLTLQGHPPPHLELLCYRQPKLGAHGSSLGVAGIEIVLEGGVFERNSFPGNVRSKQKLMDPDGHRLVLREPASEPGVALNR